MAQFDLAEVFDDLTSYNRDHIRNHEWIDSRIQVELIDQHPQLFLQMVFQYFRLDFTSHGIGGGGGGSLVPVILSAFGWFPARFACDGNVEEYMERQDELGRLWETFKGNSFYDRHGWPHEDLFDAVLPEIPPPEYSNILGLNFPKTFSQMVLTMLDCFINAALSVKQLRRRTKCPRIPFTTFHLLFPRELAFQIRVTFGLTLFAHFRSMVAAHARQYNDLYGQMVKVKKEQMNYLEGNANARAIYSVELFRILCSNEKFVNRNGTEKLSAPFVDYLVNRLDMFRVGWPVPEAKGQVDIKAAQPVTLTEEPYRYLAWNCILPHVTKLTDSTLIDILLGSMFEHNHHSHFEVLRNQLIWYFTVWDHVTLVIKNTRNKISPLSIATSNKSNSSSSSGTTKQPSPVTEQYLWDSIRNEYYPANLGFSNGTQVNEDSFDSD